MLNAGFIAFALFHAAVPVVCVAIYGASPVWIPGSLLFSIAAYFTACRSGSPIVKTILCLASGINMFLTLMLGVSYYMQGTGFNAQYFYHLDITTLNIAKEAYGGVFYPSVLGLLLAFVAPLLLFYRQKSELKLRALSTTLLWAAALAMSYPVQSLVTYRMGHGDDLSIALSDLAINAPVTGVTDPHPGKALQSFEDNEAVTKNIILIYAEGLEQLYFDETIFGDIVPNIRKLSEQAHRFTNVYQVSASTKRPFEGEKCLGDILKQNGYETVFLGGAPLAFAGKGNFLRTHGYNKTLGKRKLTAMMDDPSYNTGWGLYDDSLFELAIEELESLENGDKPYLLTLLTLDTHHPDGHPSASCEKLSDTADRMSNAVFCSDQLISGFIKKAMDTADMQETIIVLFSDHLALRNTLWDKLKAHQKQRRLTWMFFDDQPGRVFDQVATHFDFAPTLLETAGISGYPTLSQGRSLLAQYDLPTSGTPPDADVAEVPRSLLSKATLKESGFEISYEDLTITVGDLSIKASKNGWKFHSGLFLLLFDEDGRVTDTLYSNDFALLMQELDGVFVVGMSIHEEESEHGDQFFFGQITQNLAKMAIQPLDSDVRVGASQLFY
jgi:phosphoglycerol transferase